MHPPVIAASILSADFARLGADVEAVLAAGADWVHFDVMDQHYVPNLTVGPLVLQSLRKAGLTAFVDVHLMVEPVDAMIGAFAQAGADLISFHPEASRHVDRSLRLIHDQGCQAGLVLNPATPLAVLDHVLELCDLVLVMSVNPGFGGQRFIPTVLPKVRALRSRIDALGGRIRLEIDGGINAETIAEARRAGADTFVVGSALFGSADYRAAVAGLRAALAASGVR